MRTAVVLLVLLTSAPLAAQEAAPGKHAPAARKIRFNGRQLGPSELVTLERLERGVGRLDDGAYWYDPRTGASGRWGGPALAF